MEETTGPTIFEIIDPTITVSADSSFVMSVTEFKEPTHLSKRVGHVVPGVVVYL